MAESPRREGSGAESLCNKFQTNAPVICRTQKELEQCAFKHKKLNDLVIFDIPSVLEDSGSCGPFLQQLKECSENGTWFGARRVRLDDDLSILRDAYYLVWLQTPWSHHPDFRFWLILNEGSDADEDLHTPASHDFTANWAQRNQQFLLAQSAVYLRYCDDFDEERRVRELVSAVEGSQYYRVLQVQAALTLMRNQDIVDLFRLAIVEDVFEAITQDASEEVVRTAVMARDAEGCSPLDVAIAKGYTSAAVKLRDTGCKSEAFNFDLLLDASFQEILRALLDPDKPFPFDAKESCSCIAGAGRNAVLRRLFACRVDVDFAFHQYPLLEACNSQNKDCLLTTIDRMGTTGVHPLRDSRIAAHFLRRILLDCFDEENQVYPEDTTLWFIEQLAKSLLDDEAHCDVPALGLKRLQVHPKEMKLVLGTVDVDKSTDTESLILFFIEFDPENPVAAAVSRQAMDEIVHHPDVETKSFRILRDMIRCGPRTGPMFREALHTALARESVTLTRRHKEAEGATLLMTALQLPVNLVAMRALLDADTAPNHPSAHQIDPSGNNVLVRLVVDACQLPALGEPEWNVDEAADAVRALIETGVETKVSPPTFSMPLFSLLVRQDLGAMAFELKQTVDSSASPVTGISWNVLSLMVERADEVGDLARVDARISSLTGDVKALALAFDFLELAEAARVASFCSVTLYAFLHPDGWRRRFSGNITKLSRTSSYSQARDHVLRIVPKQ